MDVGDHSRPLTGRREVPLTRRQAREAQLREERARGADPATVETPVAESRRARRLREQAAALAQDPAGAAPAASLKHDVATEPEAMTGSFRFDVGTIPLAPYSVTALPVSAPVAPVFAGEDRASITADASMSLGRIIRRSLSVTLAAGSVAGLILTAAIPSLAPIVVADGTQATAIQRLSLGNSADSELPLDLMEGVDGVEIEADAATLSADTYTNNPNGLVQYPFRHGVPLTDVFGYRTAPVAQFHDAQDFAAGDGAAVRSIAGGVVIESGQTTDGCGTGIKIEHVVDGLEVESRYCHLREGSEQVEVGDEVRSGQMIGRVGATGMAFGAHLHFVIEVEGKAVDPMVFLEKYNAISR